MTASLLTTCAFAMIPAASADCQTHPIVTVGGTDYPSNGLYSESGCSPGAQGNAGVTVTTTGPGIVPAECQYVPIVGVNGNQVPGTGQNHCTPAVGGSTTQDQRLPPYSDAGFVVCAEAIDTCSVLSPYFVNFQCQGIDTGDIALPTGETIRVACTLA